MIGPRTHAMRPVAPDPDAAVGTALSRGMSLMHSDDGSLDPSSRDRGKRSRGSAASSRTGEGVHVGGAARPLQVLIAEDMALIALDLEDLVETMGHEVVASVTTAEAAVTVARRTDLDVALMDVRLGRGGDGVAAAIVLYREHGIRSIFITAHGDAETMVRAAAAEPLGFLLKPLSPSQLARLLRQASSSRPPSPGPAGDRPQGPSEQP